MSKVFIASVLSFGLLAAACGGADGTDDATPADAPAAAPRAPSAASPAPSSAPTPAATASSTSTTTPAVAKCPELGVTAFFCDGFEAPSIGAAWAENVTTDAVVAGFDASHPAGGAHSLKTAFDPLPPDAGHAALEYRAAFQASPRPTTVALQFSVFLPSDGYPSSLPLGGFRSSSGSDALTFALVGGKQIALTDTTGGAAKTTILGDAKLGAFTCVETQIDQFGAMKAWLGSTLATTSTLAGGGGRFGALDTVEIGLAYSDGANANASIIAHFDDVVVAPTAVGCLH